MTYSQHIDVGLNLIYTLTNLNAGTTYYFALTAENTQGASSGYSNEVSYSSSVQTADPDGDQAGEWDRDRFSNRHWLRDRLFRGLCIGGVR